MKSIQLNRVLIGINAFLAVLVVLFGLILWSVWHQRQVSDFVQDKQSKLVTKGRTKARVGNIDTTYVVAAIPTDETGKPVRVVEEKILKQIGQRIGKKKPAGEIQHLFFISSEESSTNFKDAHSCLIQIEEYDVEQLGIKKTGKKVVDRVLLTQDNELLTLSDLVHDLSKAHQIFSQALADSLDSQGVPAEQHKSILQAFWAANLDQFALSYSNSQLTLEIPEADFQISSVTISIASLYSVLNGAYLTDKDKAGLEAHLAQLKQTPQIQQLLALTFDDGPDAQTTPKVLDILKKHNAKATFFLIGKLIAGKEGILKRMQAEGHQIANHTWNHPNLTKLSPAEVQAEIKETQSEIARVTGQEPSFFRPPYGAVNASVTEAAGLPSIAWSVDSKDWQSRHPQAILDEIKSQAHPGAIVLLHDIHPSTVEALDGVLQHLTEQGYQLVTITDLLGSHLDPRRIYYSQDQSSQP